MKRFAHFYRGVFHIKIKKNPTILFLGKQLILLN